MGRNIDNVIAGLPKARRDRIETKAVRLASEMIEHADSLGDIRKAMSKTQSEIARELGVGQVAVAQLEKRSDLLLSTLQRYVRAAGAELSLVIHTKQGTEIVLQSLGDLGGKGNAGTKLGRTNSRENAKRRGALGGAK
jgi:transcriptional regulator with XRE-family HTH domain